MDLNEWFNKGLTRESYIDSMKKNKEELLHIKTAFQLKDKDQAQSLANHQLRAIILTADWCGDAMVNLPVFMAIADAANIEERYFIRDENLELMDQFLTNGTARSIPIIALIDKEGDVYAKWGPRASNVQTIVDEYKSSLPEKDDSEYEARFYEMVKKLTVLYTKEESIWSTIEEDMLGTFIK